MIRSITFILACSALVAQAADKVPLVIELPEAQFMGTPKPLGDIPNLEPPSNEARKPIMVPAGTTLLSEGKPVTGSDDWPIIGELEYITDGYKQGEEGYYVELAPGLQWVQIDLEQQADIQAVVVWHFHAEPRVYHDVIVQVSNDPDFTEATVIYNNDYDNSSTFGKGAHNSYIESNEGRLISVNGKQARYVRLYTNGNTSNSLNHYIEVEVYGIPGQSYAAK